MRVVEEKNISARTIIQSFDSRTLKYLHVKYPDVKTALLIESFDEKTLKNQLDDLGFVPTIYSPNESLVDQQLINNCHQLGMKIIPWTVNDTTRMKALKTLGVDGIITDFPNLIF